MAKKKTSIVYQPGQLLRELRAKRTLEDISLGSGVGVRSLYRYERGEEPTPRIQKKLAEFFGVDRRKLF